MLYPLASILDHIQGLPFINLKFRLPEKFPSSLALADTEFVINFILQFLSNSISKIRRKFTVSPFVWATIQIVFFPCNKAMWSRLISFRDQRPRGEFGTV